MRAFSWWAVRRQYLVATRTTTRERTYESGADLVLDNCSSDWARGKPANYAFVVGLPSVLNKGGVDSFMAAIAMTSFI